MVDFHTHILPCVDDGSQSVSESVSLLRMLQRQGVCAVAATPHFYADQNSPKQFLENRNRAWEQLQPYLWEELPEVHLGAEVQYFDGITGVEAVNLLKLEGTDLLLLEMPFRRWTDRMVSDVLELNAQPGIQVVLAHIERYMREQPKDLWLQLCRSGVLMQSNVSFFANWKTRHKAMSMLKKGQIHILGSDCHNKAHRPPNWDLLPDRAKQMAEGGSVYLPEKREMVY